jgi:beta-mannanase
MIKSFSKIPLKQKQRMLASFIILAFACIGVIGLIISHAATPFVSVEAESGTLTGPASVGSSTQASGSKYVQFGQTQTVADNKMLCIYTANSISAMNTLSEDMNTPIHCATAYANNVATWSSWIAPWVETPPSANNDFSSWLASNSLNRFNLSIQLVPNDVSVAGSTGYDANWMEDCANGEFESYAVELGNSLVKSGFANTMLRIGIEMNGNWNDDSLGSSPTTQSESYWAQCFAKTVTGLRSAAGSHFLMNWNVNQAYRNIPFANYYPGNNYVDVIGMDAYDDGMPGDPQSQPARWNAEYSEGGGLEDIIAFAKANNKPMSLPEWGLDSTSDGFGDDPYYVQQIENLVANNNFMYQSYFDSNDDNIPLIQSEPNAFAAYKAAFDTNGSSGPGTSW